MTHSPALFSNIATEYSHYLESNDTDPVRCVQFDTHFDEEHPQVMSSSSSYQSLSDRSVCHSDFVSQLSSHN